jgi:hypothetical protein
MLQYETLPPSLAGMLWAFRPCFTAPSFRTFCALVGGLVAQPGRRTVCGMLTAAGLAGVWHHSRAHWFFSRARWQPMQLSAVLVRLVVQALPDDAPVLIAVDDTLLRRSGRKVHAAGWFHDGAADLPPRQQRTAVGWGHNWVIAGIVVHLPFLTRQVCLPVAMALVSPAHTGKAAGYGGKTRPVLQDSKHALASQLITAIHTTVQQTSPGRSVHVVADSWYAGLDGAPGAAVGAARQRGLPDGVTHTSRLRSNAALYHRAAPDTGRRGRPKLIGDKIGTPADLARHHPSAAWRSATITRYGRTEHVHILDYTCLWYGVYRTRPVRVILVRDRRTTTKTGYQIALISTDLHTTTEHLIERYAARWSIEAAIEDAKQHTGTGDARNRTPNAVDRTAPFTLITQTLVTLWYTHHGHHPDIITDRRTRNPWYRTKTQPAYHDMLTTLRRTLIATQIPPTNPAQPTPQEIHTLRLAWTAAAA